MQITSTQWNGDQTFTEVATVVVEETSYMVTTPVSWNSGMSSGTGAAATGKRVSGCGRLERDVGVVVVVVCLFVFCFSWGGVGGAF